MLILNKNFRLSGVKMTKKIGSFECWQYQQIFSHKELDFLIVGYINQFYSFIFLVTTWLVSNAG
jgi:hypothetical protein